MVTRQPNHKNEKTSITEGKCHKCQSWIAVEGIKCVEAKLKEIYWYVDPTNNGSPLTSFRWKHAAACHKGSNIQGEEDHHTRDPVGEAVMAKVELCVSFLTNGSDAHRICSCK